MDDAGEPPTTVAPAAGINSAATSNNGAGPAPACYFIEMLPFEIRIMIYRLLLTDPLLTSVAPFHRVREEPADPNESSDSDGSDDSDTPSVDEEEDEGNGNAIAGENDLDAMSIADSNAGKENKDNDIEHFEHNERSEQPEHPADEESENRATVIKKPEVPVLSVSGAIMRTCRQIYLEANAILYDTNVFVFALFNNDRGQCALFKRQDSKWRFPIVFTAEHAAAINRVKHWKVIIGHTVYDKLGRCIPFGLIDFCWALRGSEVQTIDLRIVREKIKLPKWKLEHQHSAINRVLQPFDLVRNLTRFHIAEVNMKFITLLDLPDHTPSYRTWPGQLLEALPTTILGDELIMRLEATTQGDSPIMYLFTPLKALVAYGVAFESNERHKLKLSREFHQFLVLPYEEAVAFIGRLKRRMAYVGPGPMELLIPHAYSAAVVNDTQDFRNARMHILGLLEDQYERMEADAQQMFWFSYMMKLLAWEGNGHFIHHKHCCLIARDFVLKWAEDFEQKRYGGPESEPLSLELIFGRTPVSSRRREKLIRRMRLMGADLCGIKRCKRYMHLIRKLVGSLREQYIEARQAREALYRGDRVADPDAIPLHLMAIDGPIDWTIKRPPVDPGPFEPANGYVTLGPADQYMAMLPPFAQEESGSSSP